MGEERRKRLIRYAIMHPSYGPYPVGEEFEAHYTREDAESFILNQWSTPGFPEEVKRFQQAQWEERQAEGWFIAKLEIFVERLGEERRLTKGEIHDAAHTYCRMVEQDRGLTPGEYNKLFQGYLTGFEDAARLVSDNIEIDAICD